MRKVFLSSIFLNDLKNYGNYYSNELKMSKEPKKFFVSHIIDSNIEQGDEVVIITNIPGKVKNEVSKKSFNLIAADNYNFFKQEVMQIMESHCISEEKVTFIEVVGDSEFSTMSCHTFFKKVAFELKEDDVLYIDITFGMKPYTFSMFIAAAYAVKAAMNIKVALVAYAERYDGSDSTLKEKSIGYDLTSLFYLNEIAGNVEKGNKESTDKVFDVLIS